MINKKLIEDAIKFWIDVDIEKLKNKWLPDDVINDILESAILWKEWQQENFIDYDEYVKLRELNFKKMKLCID